MKINLYKGIGVEKGPSELIEVTECPRRVVKFYDKIKESMHLVGYVIPEGWDRAMLTSEIDRLRRVCNVS